MEAGEDATTVEGYVENLETDVQEAARENDEPEGPLPEGSDEAEYSNEDESSVYGNDEHETHLTAEAKGQNTNQSEPKRQDANELNISCPVSVEPEISNSTEDITTKSTLLPTGSGKGKELASDQNNPSDPKPLYKIPSLPFEDDYMDYNLHDSQGYIHFRDYLGRYFAFPFLLVNTYKVSALQPVNFSLLIEYF